MPAEISGRSGTMFLVEPDSGLSIQLSHPHPSSRSNSTAHESTVKWWLYCAPYVSLNIKWAGSVKIPEGRYCQGSFNLRLQASFYSLRVSEALCLVIQTSFVQSWWGLCGIHPMQRTVCQHNYYSDYSLKNTADTVLAENTEIFFLQLLLK